MVGTVRARAEILKTAIKDNFRANRQLSPLLEEHWFQALASGVDRLKEHHVVECRPVKDIPNKKTAQCHDIAQNRKVRRQLQEISDGFGNLSSETNQ